MKKVIALLSIAGLLAFSNFNGLRAGEPTDAAEATEQVTDSTAATADSTVAVAEEEAMVETTEEAEEAAPLTFHQVLKQKYIEGGAGWMTPILVCLLIGLALVIERVLYLNLATTNVEKLLAAIEEKVKKGDYNGAKEVCRETRGPVASIFYQGLDRIDEGLENVEKAITSYGGVQMGRLESNLSWIALFIAIAPMFGFLGTVVGMVQAFDDIEKAGDISPTVVAGGMKLALITTVFGLICGLILQICYNYLISKIEGLVNTMEDSSITFMDILIKNRK
ncbi:MAG: MotA/TolQ/ExbB proton channel family protein [Bacteroidales bacterium]|jgi:biopolymer transport protein ExbB|nr:MotA/TolQ/ExbB proton channel family protein [Bacteroidales bacterium]